MDKQYIAKKFEKSLNSYNKEAVVQAQVVEQLFQLLEQENITKKLKVFEFGAGTGLLSQKLLQSNFIKELTINDLSPIFSQFLQAKLLNPNAYPIHFKMGDIEEINFPTNCDLIISCSTEQWIDNKPAFYQKIAEALKPEGLFIFSSFGTQNLKNLSKASGMTLKYYDINETKEMLSKHFTVSLAKEQLSELNFENALSILKHLKQTGVNSLSKEQWTAAKVHKTLNKIEKYCQKDEQFQLVYHPTLYIARKKRED